jgi:hypothetical protein
VEGVTGKYFDTNSKKAAWPPVVMDKNIREFLWETMKRFAG